MSRRSRRGTVEAFAALSRGVQSGLKRLVADNTKTVAQMLDVDVKTKDDDNAKVVALLSEKCAQVMKQQQLSASSFLASFFAADILAEHATEVLGKSGKGSAATLGDRIAAEWAKDRPLPAAVVAASGVEVDAPTQQDKTTIVQETVSKKKKKSLVEAGAKNDTTTTTSATTTTTTTTTMNNSASGSAFSSKNLNKRKSLEDDPPVDEEDNNIPSSENKTKKKKKGLLQTIPKTKKA